MGTTRLISLILASALAQEPGARDVLEVFAAAQQQFGSLALESLPLEAQRRVRLGELAIGDIPRTAEMKAVERRLVAALASRPGDATKENGADELLALAARSGMPDVVAALLAGGADPEARYHGRSALSWAIQADSLEAVQALVAAGADAAGQEEDPVSHTLTPRVVAAADRAPGRAQGVAILGVLLDHGGQVDAAIPGGVWVGETASIKAARRGNAPVVAYLLGRGANPNYSVPETGHTPLMAAAGYPDVARVLLDGGAKIETTDRFGRSATIFAALGGCAPAVEFLRSRGGATDRPDQQGKTADQYLAEFGEDAVPQGTCNPAR